MSGDGPADSLASWSDPPMTAPLQSRPTGARLPFGEWFNVIIARINQMFGSSAIQIVAAAGATQGTATPISAVKGLLVKVTVTASTQGVKLPVASTGLRLYVMADPSVGVKVYPATGGFIGSAASNAAVALVKAKTNLYVAVDKLHWRTQVGA